MATILENPIHCFIKDQVNKGNAKTECEAEAQIIKTIKEREAQRRIEKGRQDVKDGKTKLLDKDFVESLKARVVNEINNNKNL